ncbi:MAG: guanylate kinase, partial [Lachnospiraceae bacterium]|nr:guanylate kinase [Lachnospiraceae bacterium]
MKQQGILAVVSGFSGAGKGTIMKALLNKYDNYALSISATTRNPREGEMHGREYFFLTTEQFEEMIEKDQFIEYAQYVKNYYGTPRSYVEEKMAEGKDVILEIEIQGALKVKEKFPETLLVFVVPPSAEDLKNRLVGRGTETPEVIEERMARALVESEEMDSYDYILVNDTVDKAVDDLHNLIQSQH